MDETLFRATQGKTASRGGLNIKQFREDLVKCYPKKEKKICGCKTRKDLEAYCKRDRNINAAIKRASKSYGPGDARKSSPRGAGRRSARRVVRRAGRRSARQQDDTSYALGMARKAGRRSGRRVNRRNDNTSYAFGTARRTGRRAGRRSQSPDSPIDKDDSDCGCSMSPDSPTEKEDCGCSASPKSPRKDYFKANSPLTDRQRAYCRCIAHVAAKNPTSCYQGKSPEWKLGPKSKTCVNPYSVCAASVGTTSRCYNYYDFRKVPQNEVSAIKRLHGK